MKWNYKCHNVLDSMLRPLVNFHKCVTNISWYYAHYHNGSGPRIESLQKLGLLGVIKREFKDRKEENF